MYKIVICDDDKIFVESLKNKVKKEILNNDEDCMIEHYFDGKTLLKEVEDKIIDVLFLDIDMPEVTGIELADVIKQSGIDTNIVFITNREDLVFRAIHYQPFRFIRKEKLKDELPEAIKALIKKMQSEDKLINLHTKEGNVILSIKDIMYIESCKHYLFIYCEDHTYEVRDKISNYENYLNSYGFLKIHRSYLVNVRVINSIKAAGVELDNEELLPVSRDKVQELKRQYLSYTRKFVYGNN